MTQVKPRPLAKDVAWLMKLMLKLSLPLIFTAVSDNNSLNVLTFEYDGVSCCRLQTYLMLVASYADGVNKDLSVRQFAQYLTEERQVRNVFSILWMAEQVVAIPCCFLERDHRRTSIWP